MLRLWEDCGLFPFVVRGCFLSWLCCGGLVFCGSFVAVVALAQAGRRGCVLRGCEIAWFLVLQCRRYECGSFLGRATVPFPDSLALKLFVSPAVIVLCGSGF